MAHDEFKKLVSTSTPPFEVNVLRQKKNDRVEVEGPEVVQVRMEADEIDTEGDARRWEALETELTLFEGNPIRGPLFAGHEDWDELKETFSSLYKSPQGGGSTDMADVNGATGSVSSHM